MFLSVKPNLMLDGLRWKGDTNAYYFYSGRKKGAFFSAIMCLLNVIFIYLLTTLLSVVRLTMNMNQWFKNARRFNDYFSCSMGLRLWMRRLMINSSLFCLGYLAFIV